MSTRQSRRLSTQTNLSTRPKRRLSTQTNVSTRPPLKRPTALSTRRNTLAPPTRRNTLAPLTRRNTLAPLAPPAPSAHNKCSLADVLTLGRETGAYIEPELREKNQEQSQPAPDERLTSLLGDMLRLQDELYQLKNEKHRLADDLSSFDVVRSHEIDVKTTRLQTLASHLDHLLAGQRSLLVRLKQPYAGECVRVEPEFHSDLEDLFPRAIRSIKTVPRDAENAIMWRKTTVSEDELGRLLSSTSSALAAYGNYADGIEQLRRIIQHVQPARIGEGDETGGA